MHALQSPEEATMREHTRQALRASTKELLDLSSESLSLVAQSI